MCLFNPLLVFNQHSIMLINLKRYQILAWSTVRLRAKFNTLGSLEKLQPPQGDIFQGGKKACILFTLKSIV